MDTNFWLRARINEHYTRMHCTERKTFSLVEFQMVFFASQWPPAVTILTLGFSQYLSWKAPKALEHVSSPAIVHDSKFVLKISSLFHCSCGWISKLEHEVVLYLRHYQSWFEFHCAEVVRRYLIFPFLSKILYKATKEAEVHMNSVVTSNRTR